jgi:nucleoside 2-deoxyribosyltransferase
MKTMYLAGAINGRADAECRDWREEAKRIFKVWRFLDPMARDYRGREAESVKEIVEGDKADIDASDVLVVRYDKPSVGTSMEIIYAWERGKPVFVVAAPGTNLSPWIRYHARGIFGSLEELAAGLVAAGFHP